MIIIDENMSYFVYILGCSDGTLYTGYTNSLEKRLLEHNRGTGAKYTKSRRPCKLLYSEEFETRSEAMKREWEIKHKYSRLDKERMISGIKP